MPKKKRKPLIQQKHIVSLEALLILRWLLRYCENIILEQMWSPWFKITAIMAILAGVLGWFLVIIQRISSRSVEGTQRIVEKLPLPMPMFFIHILIFAIIFAAYAWQLGMLESISADVDAIPELLPE